MGDPFEDSPEYHVRSVHILVILELPKTPGHPFPNHWDSGIPGWIPGRALFSNNIWTRTLF
jgi:hypothetical protein